MPIRTAGPPMNSSCGSRVISTTLPSAGATSRPGPSGTRRGGSRKKETIRHNSAAGSERGVPEGRDGQQNRQRQERPAHQLQLGQAPAGETQPAAPAERVVGLFPIARAAVAAELQVAGVEDFVGRPGRVAPPQGGHAADVARPEMLEPPPPPAAPGQFDPIADPTPRLHGDEILRQRLRFGSGGGGFGRGHGIRRLLLAPMLPRFPRAGKVRGSPKTGVPAGKSQRSRRPGCRARPPVLQ